MRGEPSHFWGKLETVDGRIVAWHPLADHCADVAVCCEALLRETLLGRRLAALGGLEQLTDTQIARLGVLAALHDIGKYNLGFQNKALPRPAFKAGHLSELLGLFGRPYEASRRLQRALPVEEIDSWGPAMDELLVATISHHGRPVKMGQQVDPRVWGPARGLDPFTGIADLVARTRDWFPSAWQPGSSRRSLLPSAPGSHPGGFASSGFPVSSHP